MMKKNLVTLFVTVSVLASVMAGCGDKEVDESKSVESLENPTPIPAVTGDGVIMEGPSDDGVMEIIGEVTEISDGDVTEDTEDNVTEVIGEVTTDVISDDGMDWSVKYDDYFERTDTMPESLRVTITTIGENVTMPYGVVAVAGEEAFMSYDFGTAAIDMYIMTDKVYAFTRVEEQEMWYMAPVSDDAETMGLADMADPTLLDREDMAGWTYREAIQEDGVVYDVLDVTVEEETGGTGTATYFINRETQLIEKCVMEAEGVSAVCLVEEIEEIQVPAEAEEGTEVSMEDIMGTLLGVMFIGSGAGEITAE